jgi:hypothetical protein
MEEVREIIIVVYFKGISRNVPGGSEMNHKNTQNSLSVAETRIEHLQNTKREHCMYVMYVCMYVCIRGGP